MCNQKQYLEITREWDCYEQIALEDIFAEYQAEIDALEASPPNPPFTPSPPTREPPRPMLNLRRPPPTIDEIETQGARECSQCGDWRGQFHFLSRPLTAGCRHPITRCMWCMYEYISSHVWMDGWNMVDCPDCNQRLTWEEADTWLDLVFWVYWCDVVRNPDRVIRA